jgi:hypothetical protein
LSFIRSLTGIHPARQYLPFPATLFPGRHSMSHPALKNVLFQTMTLQAYYARMAKDEDLPETDGLRMQFGGEKFMLEALAGPEQKRQVLDRLRAEGLKIPHCGALRFLKNHKNPAREIVFWTPAGRRVAWHQPLPAGLPTPRKGGPAAA